MKKILIVEDNKKLSLAWAIRLKSAGYEVSVSPDGFRGFTSAVTQKPDLILMDIWMPIGNGFVVAENLQGVGLGDIPIIFTTASRKNGLWERAQEVGAAGFLEKPVTSAKLLETIAQTLQRNGVRSEARSKRGGPKRILVVDDDKHIVRALSLRLEAAGYQVLTAPNGLEGIKKALAWKPDLVLMDIWMPVGLGFSVAQRLAQMGLGDIPIIFITASKVEGLRKAASGLGAVGFLEKPYDSQELLATISAGLDPEWRRQRDRLNSPRPDGSTTK